MTAGTLPSGILPAASADDFASIAAVDPRHVALDVSGDALAVLDDSPRDDVPLRLPEHCTLEILKGCHLHIFSPAHLS